MADELHKPPLISVVLTRDSVCAGDDCSAPHERRMVVSAFAETLAFANQFATGYLASVNGIGHSWTMFFNDAPIARFTVSEIHPLVPRVTFEESNRVHFEYHSATF